MSRWVLAARGSRETWAAGPLRVVTGRRCWRQVCCPCACRRRDRFQGARWRPGCPAGACGDPGVIAVNGRRARPSGVDDGRVLPVTPCGPWRFAPGYESGGGGDLAGWVLSLSSTPIRFGFPRAVPRAASFLPVSRGKARRRWPRGKTRRTAPGCLGTAATARRWPRSSRRWLSTRPRSTWRRGPGWRAPGCRGPGRTAGGRRCGR